MYAGELTITTKDPLGVGGNDGLKQLCTRCRRWEVNLSLSGSCQFTALCKEQQIHLQEREIHLDNEQALL